MTKTADTSHLMEKEKTKLHPVLVTIKKKLNVCAYRLRLGKFLTSLLWEGEVEMPTLSSFAGLWAGNALGPLQSSSIRAPPLRNVWRPETTREHWTARACAFPASQPLPAPALVSAGPPHHQGELQGQRRGVWQDFCEPCRLWDSCKGLPAFEPTALLKRNKELKCHCSISTFSLTPD